MEAAASSSRDVRLTSPNSDTEDILVVKDTKKDSGSIMKCSFCNLEERYDYKGAKPPFAKHLSFLEDCYIMKDPFSSTNKGEILVLGADCSICRKSACVECSLFYAKRFCKVCSLKNIKHFPLMLQKKIIFINQESDEEEM